MASLIQDLENNEALLLMYFTDELPAEDRAEVEQMLANDAGLRANLAQIQAAYSASMEVLAKIDQDRSAEPAENHAVRQASRAMRQWQVDRLSRQPVVLPSPRTKVPVWAYPIGVAVMLLIGALIWWGGQADSLPVGKVASTNTPAGQPDPSVSPEDLAKANLLEKSFNEVPAGISDAESQANSLIARSDSDSVASSIFLTEGNQ